MKDLIQQSKDAGLTGWWANCTKLCDNDLSPIFRHWHFKIKKEFKLGLEDFVIPIKSVPAWDPERCGVMFNQWPWGLAPEDDPVFIPLPAVEDTP